MKKRLTLLIFLIVHTCVLAQGTRLYVNLSATGANSGQSWVDAYTSLQNALQQAQAGDEIWVAAGNYRPTSGADRSMAFEPKSGVRLYGGFAGTESSITGRDWKLHPCILSGDIGIPGDSTDNSYNVLYLHQPDSNTVVDGFFVRDGQADGSDGGAFDRLKCGGGLYIMGQDWEAYATIRNCVFQHNTAKNYGGGAMVNGTGDGSVAPRFINCRFDHNTSKNNGGGLACIGAAWIDRDIKIDSCIFFSNITGGYGGGLAFFDLERTGIVKITSCDFIKNRALKQGGGAYLALGRENGSECILYNLLFDGNASASGAAINIDANSFLFTKSIKIGECQFYNNSVDFSSTNRSIVKLLPLPIYDYILDVYNFIGKNNKNGPSLVAEGGGLSDSSTCLINKLVVEAENSTILVALVYFRNAILRNATFSKNSVFSAILRAEYCQNVHMNNILCIKNNGKQYSKYFTFEGTHSVLFSNATIYKNSIYDKEIENLPNRVVIANSWISDVGEMSMFWNSSSQTIISHSAFDTLDCSALPPNVTCGPGILTDIDPQFVNPDTGDFRLQACSPLINAGSNAFLLPGDSLDLGGQPRVRSSLIDIGAYESQGPILTAAPTVEPSCPGGASGAVLAEIQDACLPLHYQWQAGSQSGTKLTGLSSGNYQITLTDAKGQALVFSTLVPSGPPLSLLPVTTPILCGDSIGGSASASLVGGTAPYAFSWASGHSDSLRTGLPAGAYPLTLTDARGCQAAGTLQISKIGSLSVDFDIQKVTCFAAADGTITVLPVDGKAPWQWNWTNGSTSPTLGPLGPGTYSGTLTDALGCTIQWILPLSQPGPLQANPLVVHATDSLSTDGRITLMPSGGTGPFQAKWSTGAFGLSIQNLQPGAYTVTLTDAQGCTAVETLLVGITSTTWSVGDGQQRGWILYPNPARGQVWIELGQAAADALDVRLFTTDGLQVGNTHIPAGALGLSLDTSSLADGIYIVQVANGFQKLIVH